MAEREQIVYHVTDNLRLACVQPSTNFLTNMTIETFHAGHLGRHLATTSRERKAANRSDRTDRQLNLAFQDTCVGQHSQFLRCFPGDGPWYKLIVSRSEEQGWSRLLGKKHTMGVAFVLLSGSSQNQLFSTYLQRGTHKTDWWNRYLAGPVHIWAKFSKSGNWRKTKFCNKSFKIGQKFILLKPSLRNNIFHNFGFLYVLKLSKIL